MDLNERLRSVIDEMDELSSLEELTDEQTTRFAELEAESEVLLGKAERAKKIEALRQAARDPRNVVPGALPELDDDPIGEPESIRTRKGMDPFNLDEMRVYGRDRFEVAEELRDRALAGLETMPGLNAEKREHLAGIIARDGDGSVSRHILTAGHPDYMRAFVAHIAGRPYTPAESDAVKRAMGLTTTAGGFLIPTPLDPTLIITGAGSKNPFRRISRTETGTTNSWNGVSAGQVTASWDAEAAEVSDDTATYAQPSIDAHKGAVFTPVSIEAFQDIPNLTAVIAELTADAKDNLEASAFATGTGTGEPYGVVTQVAAVTASVVTCTTAGTYGVGDLYSVYNAVPARHEDNITWVMNKSVISLTRQFATANNYHAFLVDLGAGQPSMLLGAPLYSSSAMDSTITTTTTDSIVVVGDFSRFLIYDRVGLSVEGINHLFATANGRPTGQRGFYAFWRVGSKAVDTNAFRVLNNGT